jgi:putative transcriptional regulator
MHRQLASLTQEDLAQKLGVTRQTVIAIENGKYSPTLEIAFMMAKVLGTGVEELFQYPSEDEDQDD